MENAGVFCVVVLWLLCDADGLGKEAGLLAKWSVLGRKRPCCRMLLMLPRGPVWPALVRIPSLVWWHV